MRLLLDTVAFICAVTSADRISDRAMAALRSGGNSRNQCGFTLGSCPQAIDRKVENWQRRSTHGIADLRLRVLPYTADHALHLFDLPLHHSDPFDRQIIA